MLNFCFLLYMLYYFFLYVLRCNSPKVDFDQLLQVEESRMAVYWICQLYRQKIIFTILLLDMVILQIVIVFWLHKILDTVQFIARNVAGGLKAINLFPVSCKKSWVGQDPARSNIAAENTIINTDSVVWAQLLIVLKIGPDYPSSHAAFKMYIGAQAS